MTLLRLGFLTLGPLVLVAGAYALTVGPSASDNRAAAAFAQQMDEAEARAVKARANEQVILQEACTQASQELLARLPSDCRSVVHVPFVLAGDMTSAELETAYRDVVLPVSNALMRSYFDRRPDQPILLVLLKSETSFHTAAQQLDGYVPRAYSGYYHRAERRVVANLEMGQGTLAHELTHALAQFDFPRMPEWFDEGLAALHEETEFTPDGLQLVGVVNWRLKLIPEALSAGKLPPLDTLIRTQSFRGEGEGLNYAVVRAFCRYLQDRGLLCHFYRKFKAHVHDDPSGLSTLCELLGKQSCTEVDEGFRNWIREQRW